MNHFPEIFGPDHQLQYVQLNGQIIKFNIIEEAKNESDVVHVTVTDPTDEAQVKLAVLEAASSKYWFLGTEFQSGGESLTQRLRISLSTEVYVDVFNFYEKKLSAEQVEKISVVLASFYNNLRDKKLWNLESIQVRNNNLVNGKNGECIRGLEVPGQHRFELFPATFEDGEYRGNIPTSWLEGVVIHETTHIVLENYLMQLWKQHSTKLGWEVSKDVLIELPGGLLTPNYNKEPWRCPSEYATHQQDDDRAESVVVYFVAKQELDVQRRNILETILLENDEVNSQVVIEELAPDVPHLSSIKVVVSPLVNSGFKPRGAIKAGIAKPIITLEEFRRLSGFMRNK